MCAVQAFLRMYISCSFLESNLTKNSLAMVFKSSWFTTHLWWASKWKVVELFPWYGWSKPCLYSLHKWKKVSCSASVLVAGSNYRTLISLITSGYRDQFFSYKCNTFTMSGKQRTDWDWDEVFIIQSDLYYPRLCYPRNSIIRGFWGQILVRPIYMKYS